MVESDDKKRIIKVGEGFSKDEIKDINVSKLLDDLVPECTKYLCDNYPCIELACIVSESEIQSAVRNLIRTNFLVTIIRITDNGKYDYDIIDFMDEYKLYIKDLEDAYEGYASIGMEHWKRERDEEERSFDKDRL